MIKVIQFTHSEISTLVDRDCFLYPEKIPKDIPTLTYLRSLLFGCFQAVSGLGNTVDGSLGCIKPVNNGIIPYHLQQDFFHQQ